jgi:two-component system chemotaxis sensor kinase CheA
MSFNDQEYAEFKIEAIELLEVAEKSLLTLSEDETHENYKQLFDTIFRSFHNLKGAAGMMELLDLQAHTHGLENMLMTFKEKNRIPESHINFFLRGIDAAKLILDGEKVVFDVNRVDDQEAITPLRAAPLILNTENANKSSNNSANDGLLSGGVTPELRQEFVLEAEDIIERVSRNLQMIEPENHHQPVQQKLHQEIINEVYRDVHSLKGSAFLCSYVSMGEIAHLMETGLEQVRTGQLFAHEFLISSLFKGIKIIETFLLKIKSDQSMDHLNPVIPVFKKLLDKACQTTQGPASSLANPTPEKKVDLPTTQDLNHKDPSMSLPDHSDIKTPPITKDLQHHNNKDHKEHKDASDANASIRVPVSLLDNLMALMGEMVLVRNQVLQYSNKSDDQEFLSMSKRLNVVTSEIQGEMMRTRMQPIGNVLTKFSRVVRDLSLELKKSINLQLVGVETELDKSLLEAIKDPLTHIVRNSCDHGIETPEIRKQAGKSESGSIKIHAFHEGGQVVIEISDDGKGLSREILLKKGIEKGLITSAQESTMTERDIFHLIFAPGFSTAAKVTNVSGRGVGMDVVRTNIEKIGGTVELDSHFGHGTTIKLKIPLTLAIVPALIVKCGDGTFAIPQVKLEELVRVDQTHHDQKVEKLHGAVVYKLRGQILPLVDLNELLKTGRKTNYENGILTIAIVNAERQSFGLIIDEIQDTADIVVKPLNRLLKSLQIFSGATILGDGSVALIFDVMGVAKLAQITNDRREKNTLDDTKIVDKSFQLECQDYLIVRLNSETKYAIVLGYVHRLEEFKKSQIELSGQRPIIRYRDIILPLLDVNELMGFKSDTNVSSLANAEENVAVVVIKKAGLLYGLKVNEILDTLSTSIELDSTHTNHLGIFGNLNLPEELVVVIDPFALIEHAYPPEKNNQPVFHFHPQVSPDLKKEVEKTSPSATLSLMKATTDQVLQVLLVEDTVFFRKAIQKVLTGMGYEVTTAADGKEAMDLLNKGHQVFDIILSDIEMPRMNGFELAKAIRSNQQFKNIPLLAISSRADKDSLMAGKQAGFDDYIEKLKAPILLNTISHLLDKKRTAV